MQSFIALLDKPSLPEVILQIMAWLLGEYAYLVPSLDAADVVDYVLDIMERAKTTTTRIWGVSALTKLIAQLGRVPEQVDEVLQVEAGSRASTAWPAPAAFPRAVAATAIAWPVGRGAIGWNASRLIVSDLCSN